MIKHLRQEQIDKAEWDWLLLRCTDRLWYMQSWVLDLCCPQWEALISDEGSIMPLIGRRKFGIHYLHQPYGIQQQGVFSPCRRAGTDHAFIEAVPDRYRYWDIYLNAAMHLSAGRGDRLTSSTTQTLLLDQGQVALRAGYSQGHRRNLRKAGDDPPAVHEQVGVQEFVKLFERTTGQRYRNIPEGGLLLLERMLVGSLERGQGVILGVRDRGHLVAAACFMEWEGRAILLKSANDEAGIRVQAMFHIVDRYIAMHAGSGMLLDFAGSNNASTARFNEGFGARSSVYLRLVRNRLPGPIKWLKR